MKLVSLRSAMVLLIGMYLLTSCKKKTNEEPEPSYLFKIDTESNLVMELSWTVTGYNSPGNNIVDIDLYTDSDTSAEGYYVRSSSGTSFETLTFSSAAPDKAYYLGVMYYGNEIDMDESPQVNYKFKVYPVGSSGNAQVYEGVIRNKVANSDKVYFFLKMDKSGNNYTFKEVNFADTGF